MQISYYEEATKRHLSQDGKFWIKYMEHLYPVLAKLSINSILDFGCSSGYFLETLNLPERYGYDIDEVAIAKAKEKGLRVTNIWDDIPNVDCIIVIDVVEHLLAEELFNWVGKWYSKLKENGFLIIQAANPFCLLKLMESYTDWDDKKMYAEVVIRNFLEMHGFEYIYSGKTYKMKSGKLWDLYKFLGFPFTREEYGKYWILVSKGNVDKIGIINKFEKERIFSKKCYYFLKSLIHPYRAFKKLKELYK